MTLQQIKRSVGFPAPELRCVFEKNMHVKLEVCPPIVMGVNDEQLICLEFICLKHARHGKWDRKLCWNKCLVGVLWTKWRV